MEYIIVILAVALVIWIVYFWIQLNALTVSITESNDRNDRLNQTLTGMCDMMSDFSSRLNEHIKESKTESIEISSRIKYINDAQALKLWDFLNRFQYKYNDKYGSEHIVIPSFRVLDALSMVNQDKIEYSEG